MSRNLRVDEKVFYDPDIGEFQVKQYRGERRWDWLVRVIKKHNFTMVAELGLGAGKNATQLLTRCRKIKLVGVEAFEPQPDNPGPQQYEGWNFEQKLNHCRGMVRKFESRFLVLKGYTHQVSLAIKDGVFDLVFVDADHSYRSTKQDIIDWKPKVRKGGLICGHDFNWPTVRRAVEETCQDFKFRMNSDKVWWSWV